MVRKEKTVRAANYAHPIQLSVQVLKRAGIDSFPVSLKKILRYFHIILMSYEDYCRDYGCDMKTCLLFFGKDGATVKRPGGYMILYNKQASPKERIRFTLAHELGHIVLKHHNELGDDVLKRFGVDKTLYDVMEDEANCFARNLLCPALAVKKVLYAHGFRYSEYDERQKRYVWLKVHTEDCLPGLPDNLTDFYLIKQSFLVTPSAARIRCGLLRLDLNKPLNHELSTYINEMRFTAQWRCQNCGALRRDGSDYCYHCGSRNRFGLITGEAPSHVPVSIKYARFRYSVCPVCGNADIADDANYCIICGNPVSNPCMPRRIRNRSISRLLSLVKSDTVHLNPPGTRYCLSCGAKTVYGIASESRNIPLFDYLHLCKRKPNPDDQGGLPTMKYGPNIPYTTDNGQYRVTKCPKCLNEDNELDAEYCIMCGTSLINLCDGDSTGYRDDYSYHSNPANARFCRICGRPTAFFHLGILPTYDVILRKTAGTEALKQELTEMNIDEDLFWKMQLERTDALVGSDVSDDVPPAVDVREVFDEVDESELPF